MLNNKAQALVEFVLILPILIILIFAIIDFGRIFVTQNELQTLLSRVSVLDKEQMNYSDIHNTVNEFNKEQIDVALNYKDNGYLEVTLTKKVKIFTPGLNIVLNNPYDVKVNEVIKYE